MLVYWYFFDDWIGGFLMEQEDQEHLLEGLQMRGKQTQGNLSPAYGLLINKPTFFRISL